MWPRKTRRDFDMGSQLFPMVELVSCICYYICFVFVCSVENVNLSRCDLCEMCVVMSLDSIFVLSVVKCYTFDIHTVASLLVTLTSCS